MDVMRVTCTFSFFRKKNKFNIFLMTCFKIHNLCRLLSVGILWKCVICTFYFQSILRVIISLNYYLLSSIRMKQLYTFYMLHYIIVINIVKDFIRYKQKNDMHFFFFSFFFLLSTPRESHYIFERWLNTTQ